MTSGPVAAVDVGTNSTRLLVARPGPTPDGELEILDRRSVITRLGAGVGASKTLDAAAVARTVDVLAEYRSVMDALDVQAVRMTATSAARDAVNREDFFGPAEAAVGIRPELLSGDEEGRLAFLGAAAGLDPADGPFLLVDIGGGSTEFVVGTSEAEGVISVDVGSVRLTEAYLQSDPPAPEELSAAISITTDFLDDVTRDVPATRSARRMIGVAGTITTVAAVELGMAEYDRERIHQFRLTRAAAEDVFRTLATERLADRLHNPGLEPARADVIVGGCCILVAILRYFDLPECVVSESDILDGLARSLL